MKNHPDINRNILKSPGNSDDVNLIYGFEAFRRLLTPGKTMDGNRFSPKGLNIKMKLGKTVQKNNKIMPTILVIDDDMDVRVLIKSLLERQGHEVLLAEDGIQGIEAFSSSAPDIVITDLSMPRMKGIEAIKKIRQIDADTKILAISGGGNGSLETLLKQAKSAGATETLKKPFTPSDLLSAVNRFI